MLCEMTEYYSHTPVLLKESVELLITDPDGIYVDATLGGGGHSAKILEHLGPNGLLFGIDQDTEALEAATSRIGPDPRFQAVQGNFGYISTLIPPDIKGSVAGILFDLGVSTHQLRAGERGFSFQEDGPLDMRMGERTTRTAGDVINGYPYERLRDLIFHYGEERQSRNIARAIIEQRPIESTDQLKSAVLSAVSGRYQTKSLARVFQAIRIEVNRELEMLKTGLEESLQIVKPEGRLVAISYHSLEDRIVKTFFRSGNHEGTVQKDFYGNRLVPIEPINRKIIRPSEAETDRNPAARSARLRAAVKRSTEG